MKGKRASGCLVLALLLLFPFACRISGAQAGLAAEQSLLSVQSDGGMANTANPMSVVPMSPTVEVLWETHAFMRCVYLLAVLAAQGFLWKKARYTCLRSIRNIRFLVESKTSHPQQAPPLVRRAFA